MRPQAVVDRRCCLLEPRVGERPGAGDAHRIQPFLELGPAQKRTGCECADVDRLVHEPPDDRRRICFAEEPVALGVDPARRRRIEDASAADGRPCAEDDTVAARGDDRRGEPQLCVLAADADDPRGDAARSVVDGETRAVGDRLELVQLDLETVRAGKRVRSDERIAAADARGARAPAG